MIGTSEDESRHTVRRWRWQFRDNPSRGDPSDLSGSATFGEPQRPIGSRANSLRITVRSWYGILGDRPICGDAPDRIAGALVKSCGNSFQAIDACGVSYAA